jgi:hypothetical protein
MRHLLVILLRPYSKGGMPSRRLSALWLCAHEPLKLLRASIIAQRHPVPPVEPPAATLLPSPKAALRTWQIFRPTVSAPAIMKAATSTQIPLWLSDKPPMLHLRSRSCMATTLLLPQEPRPAPLWRCLLWLHHPQHSVMPVAALAHATDAITLPELLMPQSRRVTRSPRWPLPRARSRGTVAGHPRVFLWARTACSRWRRQRGHCVG